MSSTASTKFRRKVRESSSVRHGAKPTPQFPLRAQNISVIVAADTLAACGGASARCADLGGAYMTQVVTPADADRLPCNLLLEFATAGAGGKPVRLCDFGSAGMTGRFFTSWLTLDYGKRAPTAPFSQAAPTRTFVLAEHC